MSDILEIKRLKENDIKQRKEIDSLTQIISTSKLTYMAGMVSGMKLTEDQYKKRIKEIVDGLKKSEFKSVFGGYDLIENIYFVNLQLLSKQESVDDNDSMQKT